MQGYSPDLATDNEILKIFFIIIFWPIDKLPEWLG
jgi:hypothetical protein